MSDIWISLENLSWDEPTSALELNNFAVLTLIEADRSENLDLRAMHLEIALDALNKGVALQQHPLCIAHLILVYGILGEVQKSAQTAFSSLIDTIQPAYNPPKHMPLGLIYLPQRWRNQAIARHEYLQHLLQAKDGYAQALLLFAEALCQVQLVFYSSTGLRFLQLAQQLFPNSVALNLRLGIASLIRKQWEGILYLQQAQKIAPDYAPTLQALCLTYKDSGQSTISQFWFAIAQDYAQRSPSSLLWRWTDLSSNHSFTYIPFDETLLLTVEASIWSIVTSVLLAEGDWFEVDMEFWRNHIQPGMTVIDVGANVGVYTFSAAKRVGASGQVLAVEPFPGCVQCLHETIRVNELPWVRVWEGAASDRNGTLHLSLRSASELNRVVTDDTLEAEPGTLPEIPCFTLDSLIEQQQLHQVNWLKIDAEGHELQVLLGCDRLLTEFAPNILYENVSGDTLVGEDASNLAVAEFLIARGYHLFRYQPYLQTLIPINSMQELDGNLNIIALPQEN